MDAPSTKVNSPDQRKPKNPRVHAAQNIVVSYCGGVAQPDPEQVIQDVSHNWMTPGMAAFWLYLRKPS